MVQIGEATDPSGRDRSAERQRRSAGNLDFVWQSAGRAGSAKWQINPGEVDRINCDQIIVSAVLKMPNLLVGAGVPDTVDRWQR